MCIRDSATTTLWGQSAWTGESTPLRFPGQYADDESGLFYNLMRYYSPDTGRYLTPDPLGLAPAPNPYTYPSNPTAWCDPSGLVPVDCDEVDGLTDRMKELAEQHITNSGTTVLGHWSLYIERAHELGASYFDIGPGEWDALVKSGRDPWLLNEHFLANRVAAGDRILLSIEKSMIREKSYLEDEIAYLERQGYRWVNQWSLHPPKG